jgi:Bacterial protein of unknown function (DUF899)
VNSSRERNRRYQADVTPISHSAAMPSTVTAAVLVVTLGLAAACWVVAVGIMSLPWMCVIAVIGTASLADLFQGRSQLLIYHFMFGPGYTGGCPSCSSIADGFNGSVVHLANHDVTLCAVSRAPLAKLQAYKQRMGWSFP